MPPEVLRQRPAGQAADVFSFGILAYELLTRSALLSGAAATPSEREGLWAFSGLVADGWRPAIPAHWHPGQQTQLQASCCMDTAVLTNCHLLMVQPLLHLAWDCCHHTAASMHS